MKRFIASSLLTIVCTAGISNQAQAHGQSVEARQLMQATNEDRARNGLGPLKWDPALAHAAQRHAEIMVQHGALSHQYSGEADLVTRVSADGAHFREVAENLAVAPTPEPSKTNGCTPPLIGEIYWTRISMGSVSAWCGRDGISGQWRISPPESLPWAPPKSSARYRSC